MEGLVEINSMEKCSSNSSKNPRRGRRRRPRKKRQTVVSPTPTEQRVVLPPGLLHDTRICIEDLDFDETGRDELRQEREMQDECRRWNAQTAATWVKEASKLLKRDFQAYVWSLRKIQTERLSHWMSGNSCLSKWTASKAPWNMRRRGLLLRMWSLVLTMSARGPTRDVVPGTIEEESLDRTPHVCRWTASACRGYDGFFSARHRGHDHWRLARTAAMTAMGVKRMMRGAQCHASRVPRRPRR